MIPVLVVSCGMLPASVIAQALPPPVSGYTLLQAGKYREACEAFETTLNAYPDDLQARQGEVEASEHLALETRAAGHMDDALRALMQAKSYVPDNPRLLYDLGILEDEMRLYRDADATLEQLEKLGAPSPQALYAMARVKLDLGQLGPAEEKMRQYLELKPNDASAHYGLGRIYRQGLQFDKARAEFQRCIELQPKQTEGYYELGNTELQIGNNAEALANFAKTLERNPQHGGALTDSGIVYFKQKQYDKALDMLQKSIAAAPDYQPGHYYLGLTLARLGRLAESKHELEIATQLADRDNKQASNRLRLNDQAP
jgi:tetratricopeptide (TPR) repeat protein